MKGEAENMVKFEFYIPDDQFEKLMEQKEKEGKAEWTGNEFARELLLRQMSQYRTKRRTKQIL